MNVYKRGIVLFPQTPALFLTQHRARRPCGRRGRLRHRGRRAAGERPLSGSQGKETELVANLMTATFAHRRSQGSSFVYSVREFGDRFLALRGKADAASGGSRRESRGVLGDSGPERPGSSVCGRVAASEAGGRSVMAGDAVPGDQRTSVPPP